MILIEKSAFLTNETIENLTQTMTKTYESLAGKRVGNKTAFSLMAQEVLLRCRDVYGTERPCRITGEKRFGKINFTISVPGPQIDPIQREMDDYSYDILASMGIVPKYTYRGRNGGTNYVLLPGELKPKKNAMIKNIGLAIVLAVLLSFGLRCLPDAAASSVLDSFIAPCFGKLIAILTELATPLVFLSVINGITGIGNPNTFGKIGKKLLSGMMFTYIFSGILFSFFAVLFYPVSSEGGGGGSFLTQIVQLVLDIIPDNMLYAFTIDNDLQVITIAIFVGFVMLLLGEKIRHVNEFCMECAEIINRMMAIVCKLLPVVVFLGVVNLLSSDLSQLINIYKMIVLFLLCTVILIGFMLIRTKLVTKAPLGVLFQKQLPTLMINLTTSSQVSALTENMKCCKEKFGIDEKMVDFGLPLGVVVYMPCGAMFFGLVTWSLANLSGTPIGISEVIKICLVAIIVAIAAPPIPGSACAVMPIVFSACGMSNDVLPLAIIMATFLGYLLPAINGYCLQLELLISAKKLNLVDTKRMMKPERE